VRPLRPPLMRKANDQGKERTNVESTNEFEVKKDDPFLEKRGGGGGGEDSSR